jgi:hypothetical protein
MDSCIAHTMFKHVYKTVQKTQKEDTTWETQMKLEIHGSERKMKEMSVPCCQQNAGQTTT